MMICVNMLCRHYHGQGNEGCAPHLCAVLPAVGLQLNVS